MNAVDEATPPGMSGRPGNIAAELPAPASGPAPRASAGRIKKVVGYYMARRFRILATFMTQTCASPSFAVANPRLDLLRNWLGSLPAALGLAPATLTPASSDAGFRRYFRVAASSAGGRGTLIAMDAPPLQEWMGLQRHIKIIGLFARLHYRDGKPRYLTDVPRFIGYARKVARRYRELTPFAVLLDEIEGRAVQVGYTF
jgi:hypothetical protein